MIDAVFIAYYLTAFFGIGSIVHTGLALPRRSSLLTRPLLGAALSIPFSTIAYVYGASTTVIFWVLTCVGTLGLAILIYQGRRLGASQHVRLAKARAPVFLLWLVIVCLLILPKLTGGIQFSVFQGNRWDTFGYLEPAIGYSRYSFDVIQKAGATEYLLDPLLVQSHVQLFNRPAVHIFYAVCGHLNPTHMWELHYAFLMIFMSLSALAVAYFLVSVFRASQFRSMLVGAAFVLGFWGQYIIDINAWSQLAATPFFISLVGVVTSRFAENQRVRAGGVGLIALLIAACVYIYPEAFFVIAFSIATGITLTLFLVVRKWRPAYGELVIGAFLGLAAGLFFFRGTIGMVYDQYVSAGTGNVNWWKHYQAFFMGRDAVQYLGTHLFDQPPAKIAALLGARTLAFKGVDAAAGYAGLYFLTPAVDSADIWKIASRILLLVFCFVLIAGAVVILIQKARRNHRIKNVSVSLTGFLIVAHVIVLALAYKHAYWQAGKALSYFSPFIVSLLLSPLCLASGRKFRVIALPAMLYVLVSFGTGGVRTYAAAQNHGIHYPFPYPGLEDAPELKMDQDWDLSRFDRALESCSLTRLEFKHGFMEHFAMIYLTSHGKRYTTTRLVDGLFGYSPNKVGQMTVQGPADCVMTQTKIVPVTARPSP